MGWARSAALVALAAAGLSLVSGGSGADPRTPPGLPGLPPPFLGTAVVGRGGLTAAIDAYGDVVDLRAAPADPPLIDNPSDRQAAGTVSPQTGIVPWVSLGGRPARPLWTADRVSQSYRPRTDVVVTDARFGAAHVAIVYGAGRSLLACLAKGDEGARVQLRSDEPAALRRLRCDDASARRLVHTDVRNSREWLKASRPLGPAAPTWAVRLYRRSLLVLRALTDERTGAVPAGARDGWAYVWPRDAAASALAFEAGGHRGEAQRIVRFLLSLDLGAAARFYGDGRPVPGRGPQGDAAGWVAAAARAVGLAPPAVGRWRNLPDYQEGEPGNYLGNALAASAGGAKKRGAEFDGPKIRLYGAKSSRRLVRRLGDPGSGLDSAAAWAVRPFSQPRLYPAVRATLERLIARGTPYGLTPGEAWTEPDPWSAPTAWSAWSLAALARSDARRGAAATARHDRRLSLRLLADLRRAVTAAGTLPERVDARTGVPRSTTPLAWSHAFAILTLQELWPGRTEVQARRQRVNELTRASRRPPSAS